MKKGIKFLDEASAEEKQYQMALANCQKAVEISFFS